MTSNNTTNNLMTGQMVVLPPLDLYDLERHTHHVMLRENGIMLMVPVLELEVCVREEESIGLRGGGTDHVSERAPAPPMPVPCKVCGAPSNNGVCDACETHPVNLRTSAMSEDAARVVAYRWDILLRRQLMERWEAFL